jgi:WD40 repeat protein
VWVFDVALSPDEKTVAAARGDGTIKLWNVESGQEKSTITVTPKDLDHPVYAVAFSPDGKTLASGAQATPTQLWDVATGKKTDSLYKPEGTPNGERGARKIWFSSDGKTLVTSGLTDDPFGTLLFDVATAKNTAVLLPQYPQVGNSFHAAAFCSKTGMLAISHTEIPINLWNTKTAKNTATLLDEAQKDLSDAMAFSPDGKVLAAVVRTTGTIRLWNVEGRKVGNDIFQPEIKITSMAFSPDGKVLAAGGEDGTIKLWDATTRKEKDAWKEHTASVTSMVWSKDGKTLVSGSADGAIKFWSAETGKCVKTLKP